MRNLRATDLYADGVRLFIVLDFDGVLNTFPLGDGTAPDGPVYTDLETFHQPAPDDTVDYELLVTWSPTMVAALNRVIADPRAQLCWLTSWKAGVRRPAQTMGLQGALQDVVVDYPIMFSDWQGRKPEGLCSFLHGLPDDTGVVWADDYLGYELTRDRWVKRAFSDTTAKRLIIGPDERHGLTRTAMDGIERFRVEVLHDPVSFK